MAKALCPRILVVGSPGIEQTCEANNFDNFDQLLEPFGQDVPVQMTIQDGQGAPYFLDKLNIRFLSDFVIDDSEQRTSNQLSAAEIDELVRRSIEANKGSATDKEPSFANDTYVDKDALAQEEIHRWSPWYTSFRQQWINGMKVSEHESFMHPVACMLVASGSETDPIGTLQSLQKHPAVQQVQSQSFAGSNVLLYYVLVHDERDESIRQTVDLKFDQVRRALGQNAALLKINSNTSLLEADDGDERAKISAIWTGHKAAQSPLTLVQEHKCQSAYGAMITMRDVASIREALKQMMVRSVVPHMQYRIRVLSDQTANQRRGITGRLFSAGRRYFGAATKASSTQTNPSGDVYYRYDSPEGMLRKLADYSFMLKDFRFAQSVYQVAKRDSQSEKVWLCYAGAQEMVGVCKLMWEMAQANRAEFENSFQDAIATYVQKTHALSRQFFAVRCAFLYYELLKQYKLYSFTPGALLRMPMYSTGLLALTNEQAGYSYLKRMRRPEMRKFAFYAMVAAQCYQKSNMSDMSARCLRMVRWALSCQPQKDIEEEEEEETATDDAEKELTTTASSKWAAIDSYVNHELGRQCMAASSYSEALQYFMALMGDDKIPAKLQSKYLQELLQLYMESSDDSSARTELPSHVELAIPLINPELARIIMSPKLEGEDGMLTWQLDGTVPAYASLEELSERLHCCSVGETVAVLLVVTNPLAVGITLNRFSLDCQFTPAASDIAVDSDDQNPLRVSSVDSVILEGGQTTMVTVEIIAQQPGNVSIRGATYMLCDILPTFKSLKIPGKRLNKTKEDRMGAAAYSPDTALGFKVSADLPCLQISLEEFPDTLMSGSMHIASLTIVNGGAQSCKSVLLWVSHPSFFGVKSPQLITDATDVEKLDQQQSMYVAQSNVKTVDKATVTNVLWDSSTFVVVGSNSISTTQEKNGESCHNIIPVGSLEPGATISVPVWVRGDRVGAHTLKVCVGASASSAPSLSLLQENTSKVNNENICLRSRRFELDLVVTPSLRVNAFVRPSIRFPWQKLLGIEVENMQPDLHVELVQTTFTSGFFEMVPLSAKDKKSVVSIGPHQSTNLVYHVQPLEVNKDSNISRSPEQFALGALQKYIYSEEKPTTYPEPIELIYSNHTFGTEGIDSRHPALQNYLSRCQAHRRRNNLSTAYPFIPEKYHPLLFPLFGSYGIDLVLFWNEAGGGAGRSGHHSISGIDLGVPNDYLNEALNPPVEGAARMWLADTALDRDALVRSIANRPVATQKRYEQRPLDISMQVHKQGKSDDGNLHLADVEITVYNHSWRYGYSFDLVLVSPNETDQDQVHNTGSQAAWAWVGKTQFKSTVDLYGSTVVRAKLVCYMPGMLDIAMWRLHATANNINNNTSKNVTSLPTYISRSWECHLDPVQSVFINMSSSA